MLPLLLLVSLTLASRESEYRPELYSRDSSSESRRLKAQVDMAFGCELPVLRRLGLRDGMNVLVVGCGPGHYAAALLAALPSLRITCVEREPSFVRQGRKLSKRLTYVLGKASQLRHLVSPGFDAALLRLVLQHLPNQAQQLVEQVAQVSFESLKSI